MSSSSAFNPITVKLILPPEIQLPVIEAFLNESKRAREEGRNQHADALFEFANLILAGQRKSSEHVARDEFFGIVTGLFRTPAKGDSNGK